MMRTKQHFLKSDTKHDEALLKTMTHMINSHPNATITMASFNAINIEGNGLGEFLNELVKQVPVLKMRVFKIREESPKQVKHKVNVTDVEKHTVIFTFHGIEHRERMKIPLNQPLDIEWGFSFFLLFLGGGDVSMRLFDCNYLEDIEFVEFIMNSELGLGLDKSIFNSKNSVLDFFNKFCGVLNEFGIVVDGDVIIFSDWTFYHYSFFLVNAEFEIVGDLFFWVEQFTNFSCTTWTLA